MRTEIYQDAGRWENRERTLSETVVSHFFGRPEYGAIAGLLARTRVPEA
jgi:hypothetical protein